MRSPGASLAKGTVLRGYLAQLRRRGWLDAVIGAASQETAELLREPPMATTWIDGAVLEEIYSIVAERFGADAVRSLVRDAIAASVSVPVMPIVRGILRVFGVRPDVIFERLDLVFRTSLSGLTFRYSKDGPRSGVVEVAYVAHRPPAIAFVAWEATLAYGFELSATTGVVRLDEVEGGRIARFSVSW